MGQLLMMMVSREGSGTGRIVTVKAEKELGIGLEGKTAACEQSQNRGTSPSACMSLVSKFEGALQSHNVSPRVRPTALIHIAIYQHISTSDVHIAATS